MIATLVGVGGQAMWYFTRGSGSVALVLLTASFVLGILTMTGWSSQSMPRMVVEGIHRSISLLVLAFVALHVATSVLDGFVTIRWIDAVVPFQASYRGVWLGLGAVSFDLLLALTITSLLRHRLGFRTWKAVHWLAYVSWPVAMVHALGAGSDVHGAWFLLLAVVCAAAVVGTTAWRVLTRMPEQVWARVGAVTALIAVPVAILGWAYTGPLQPKSTSAAAATTGAGGQVAPGTPAATSPFAAGFSTTFEGTMTQTPAGSGGAVTLDVTASITSPAPARVHIVIQGREVDDGRVSVSSATVTLTPQGGAAWTGTAGTVQNGVLAVTLSDGSSQISTTIGLQGTGGTTVTGTIDATPGATR